ncbi:enterochelin esterase [Mixta intestinalis]|uniref:Enterochelin esterase n=1 Tax=Mixta intestinalis TaxID=1615494 RepID=A0A6P1Q626_9GAMM|nr:enterochelin esterase [Mixta intestinalis]QHM73684.1 Enterochelin esterase [Mixta intestinalis]
MTCSLQTGSEAWWQSRIQQGIPAIVETSASSCLTRFYWRDPQGDERHSTTQRVWLNINGVTDHHRQQRPFSLERIAGTDVWQGEVRLNSRWRGSYCLIPVSDTDDFPASPPDVNTLRQWWKAHLPNAIADPLNPLRSWQNGRGHPVSPLHMPDAPPQAGWQQLDRSPLRENNRQPVAYRWHSARLANRRSVWLLQTGDGDAQRPLAILLDGQFWLKSMPAAAVLEWLTQQGLLPPACYLFIDSMGTTQRGQELTCNADFWLAVQHELLPQVGEWLPVWDSQLPTLVAGQSYGGLAALYATLNWPNVFNGAISLSGSFWWPDRHTPESGGRLTEQLKQQMETTQPQRLWLEAGLHEKIILQSNRILLPVLQAQGHQVYYREFEGGHDALCWRGGLTDGLQRLWGELR